MSLVLTAITELIAQQPQLDNRINRASRYGALDSFIQSLNSPTSVITAMQQKEFQDAIGKTMKIPVIDFDGAVTIGSTRPLTITGNENTSQYISIVPTMLSWGFITYPARHGANSIAYQQDFNAKFLKYLYKVMSTIEGLALTKLGADTTQVLNDDLGYTFAANMINFAAADQDKMLGDLEVIMHGNDFYGKGMLVGNGGIESIINQLLKYQAQNDKDLTMEYAGKSLHFTNSLANGVGKTGTGYLIEEGSIGMLSRISYEAQRKWATTTGKKFDAVRLPLLNLPAEYYNYTDVVDGSTLDGGGQTHLSRTVAEYHGFSLEVAFATAHVTDRVTQPSPIIKFDIG